MCDADDTPTPPRRVRVDDGQPWPYARPTDAVRHAIEDTVL